MKRKLYIDEELLAWIKTKLDEDEEHARTMLIELNDRRTVAYYEYWDKMSIWERQVMDYEGRLDFVASVRSRLADLI